MSMKQYCFDIKNPKKIDFNPDALKSYIYGLYVGKGSVKFPKEKAPFFPIYVSIENSVCIRLTTKGKKNIERIEKINKGLKPSKLKWKGLILSKPYEFVITQQAWWEPREKKNDKVRWVSIIQRGPYFKDLMEPYKPIGGSLMYGGKNYKLTPTEEKVAVLYAKRLLSEKSGTITELLTKDAVFNRNFWKDFQTYLTPEHRKIFKDFKRIGWSKLVKKLEINKEKKPTKAEKDAKKARTEELKREYGYAKLDGKVEAVGNFTVEPVGLFMGRGKHPKRGMIKKEVKPEDVTINVGVGDPVPRAPYGHKWGKVVHDQQHVWLAKWKDSILGSPKYVQFAASGRFKGESDLAKYEKARKLQMHIDKVRNSYMSDAKSKNAEKRQLGTVLWLIDHHGIRPGDERTADQADTVGASTLRVDHVKLQGGDTIIFDFLGKDSIKFYKKLKVPPIIYKNFQEFLKGKAKTSQVFNLISAASINAYLKQFDKNFTNKVFRTRLASHIMFEALKKVKIPPDATKKTTKLLFNKANKKVAEVLNHTRSISVKAKESLKKLEGAMKELKKELKKASTDKEKQRIKKKIKTKKESIDAKKDTMAVAINTSLTNYIDPRIVVSWAERQGKGRGTERTNNILGSVYSSAMMNKFQWAIQSTPKNWNWMKSPLVGESKLQPGKQRVVRVSRRKRRVAGIGKYEIRKWCREKYGPEWYKKDKEKRKAEAAKALSGGKVVEEVIEEVIGEPKEEDFFGDEEEEPKEEEPKEERMSVDDGPDLGPSKMEKDYKILLYVCRNPRRIGALLQLHKVRDDSGGYRYPALDWIYPYAAYAVDEGVGNVKINRILKTFYEKIY